jgi:ABC-type sugar transport system substrate-binding protein
MVERRNGQRRWAAAGRSLAVGCLAHALATGCGAPTPPAAPIPFTPAGADVTETNASEPRGVARTVLLLPPEPDSLFRVYALEAKRQAGIEKLLIDVPPVEGSPPADALARAIDDAAARKASVILLVSPEGGSTPAIDAAVKKATDGGTRVVAVDRPGPAGAVSSASLRPLRQQADAILSAMLEVARAHSGQKQLGRRAIIAFTPQLQGPWVQARVRALREAAEAQGMTVVAEVPMAAGAKAKDGAQAIGERLAAAAEPPDVLLGADSLAVRASAQARQDSDHAEAIAVGGFSDDEEGVEMANTGWADAVARTNVEGPVRAAVRIAGMLLAGKEPPPPVVVSEKVIRSEHGRPRPIPPMPTEPEEPGKVELPSEPPAP